MNRTRVVRQQLDVSLRRLRPLQNITTPPKGWIRAIRDAFGMTAKQLADRLGVTQQSVTRIEKGELTGSVTIRTLRRIAERLDCVFVCGFVPRTSLAQTLRERAREVAKERLARVSHTMRLENQGLAAEEEEQVLADMVDELVDTMPSTLWNKS